MNLIMAILRTSSITYIVLCFLVALCLFSRARHTVSAIMILLIPFAFLQGIVKYDGLLILGGFWILAQSYFALANVEGKYRTNGIADSICEFFAEHKRVRLIVLVPLFIGMIILASGLLTHNVPAFCDLVPIKRVRFSYDSALYTMRLNFFGVICAIILYIKSNKMEQNRPISFKLMMEIVIAACICIGIIFIACRAHFRFDPKVPHKAIIWMTTNFFFFVFREEVLFRTILHDNLKNLCKKYAPKLERYMVHNVLVSLLFGALHWPGGVVYMIVSGIAGFVYGYMYERSERNILAAMLTHFLLNLLHFFFFSYPYLQRY